jgi:SPP1 family predicted phage head-tail adaptor
MRCCELFAGKLKNTIIIERAILTADGLGGNTTQWGTVGTIKAWIKPTSGNERLSQDRLEATTTHRIYVRFTSVIKTSDRINFNGRYMQIRALINMEERDKWLEIYADEGVTT